MNKNNLKVTTILCSLCLLSGVAFASTYHTTKKGNKIVISGETYDNGTATINVAGNGGNTATITKSVDSQTGKATTTRTNSDGKSSSKTKTLDTQTGEVITTKTGPNGNTANTYTMGWEDGKSSVDTIQRTTEAGDYYHDTWVDVNKATGTTSRDYQEVGKYGGTDKTVVNNHDGTDTLYISNSSGQTPTNYSNENLQNTKDTLKADRPSAGN